MSVEVLGVHGEVDGYGDSMEAFRQANDQNANHLLNVTEGRKKNEVRPVFDPRHPENQWPKARYHAEKGYREVGKSLKGIEDPRTKDLRAKDNERELKAVEAEGWRAEPYQKPQIAVLDPAVEKAEMLRKHQEQEGRITALTDMVQKLIASKS